MFIIERIQRRAFLSSIKSYNLGVITIISFLFAFEKSRWKNEPPAVHMREQRPLRGQLLLHLIYDSDDAQFISPFCRVRWISTSNSMLYFTWTQYFIHDLCNSCIVYHIFTFLLAQYKSLPQFVSHQSTLHSQIHNFSHLFPHIAKGAKNPPKLFSLLTCKSTSFRTFSPHNKRCEDSTFTFSASHLQIHIFSHLSLHTTKGAKNSLIFVAHLLALTWARSACLCRMLALIAGYAGVL